MKPGTPGLLRGINDRAALDLLLEHGPLSRSQLGELTGLSKPTAGQLLTRLEDAGLVITSGNTNGGPGPRAQLYAVNPDAAHVAALDVTPARILAAVADLTGRTVGEYELRTPRRPRPDAVSHVVQALDGCRRRPPGCPSPACASSPSAPRAPSTPTTRRLRYARHLPGWHDPHLLERLADDGRRSRSTSTTTSTWPPSPSCGRGRPRASRTSSCCGPTRAWVPPIVIDGRLHGGATGGAGEVGFLPLPGTPLVRDVRRGNAGGFQELAGGAAGAGAGPLARAARQPPRRRRSPRRWRPPGAGDELLAALAERFALGHRRAWSPSSTRRSSILSGGVLIAGGTRLRDLVADELGSLAPPGPGSSWPASRDTRSSPARCTPPWPPLATRSSTPSDDRTDPGTARPVTRRAP